MYKNTSDYILNFIPVNGSITLTNMDLAMLWTMIVLALCSMIWPNFYYWVMEGKIFFNIKSHQVTKRFISPWGSRKRFFIVQFYIVMERLREIQFVSTVLAKGKRVLCSTSSTLQMAPWFLHLQNNVSSVDFCYNKLINQDET